MQLVHRTSHMERLQEISFSSLQNYNSKSKSRGQSPSIAVQSTLQLTQDEQTILHLHANHQKYLHKNQLAVQVKKEMIRKYHEHEVKENIACNLVNCKQGNINQTIHQTSKRKLIQFGKLRLNINSSIQREQDHILEERKNTNDENYYSNMSPIKDQQKSSIKDVNQRSVSSFRSSRTDEMEFEQLSPETYHQLSRRYLCQTNRDGRTEVSRKNIANKINLLHIQINKLQKLKKQIQESQDDRYQRKQSTIFEDLSTSNSKEIKKKMNISNIMRKQSQFQSVQFSKTTQKSLIKSHVINNRENINEEDVKMPKLLNKISNKFKKNEKSNVKITQISFDASDKLIISENTHQFHKIQRTKIPFQKMHPSPLKIQQNNQESQKKEVKQLLQRLESQIKYDDILRKSKKWLQKLHDENKWQNLSILLRKQNVNMSQITLKQTFSMTSQQENPFYSPKDSDFNISQFCSHYLIAEKHWTSNIAGQFSTQMLKRGSFIEQNLDISKRGMINIQDLVRYINFELDTSYRNRDIFLIYNRFRKGQTLHFTGILRCLSNEPI